MTPIHQKVVDGGIVTLVCEFSGHQAPDVFWRRAGRPIFANHSRYMVLTDHQRGVSVLRIEPVILGRDNNRTFQCVAVNDLGEKATANVRVDIYPEGTSEQCSSQSGIAEAGDSTSLPYPPFF